MVKLLQNRHIQQNSSMPQYLVCNFLNIALSVSKRQSIHFAPASSDITVYKNVQNSYNTHCLTQKF